MMKVCRLCFVRDERVPGERKRRGREREREREREGERVKGMCDCGRHKQHGRKRRGRG